MGLAFLQRQQRQDGSWSLNGPYSGGAYNENVEAATAMALLAFQARNNTHQNGKFQKQVKGGIDYLLKVQGPDGNFYTGNRQDWLYTHAQCTIVICELYGMTKDSHLRLPAEKAVKFCVEAQDALGGWRYRPRMDSDTSVTGWMVMALQSCCMAGLEVPQETLKRVSEYLDRVTQDGSLYSYQVGQHPDPVMTAEALLCRQYLGWNQYDPKLVAGVQYLGSHLPNWFEARCLLLVLRHASHAPHGRRPLEMLERRPGRHAGRTSRKDRPRERELGPERQKPRRLGRARPRGPALRDLPVPLHARSLLPPHAVV